MAPYEKLHSWRESHELALAVYPLPPTPPIPPQPPSRPRFPSHVRPAPPPRWPSRAREIRALGGAGPRRVVERRGPLRRAARAERATGRILPACVRGVRG